MREHVINIDSNISEIQLFNRNHRRLIRKFNSLEELHEYITLEMKEENYSIKISFNPQWVHYGENFN